MPNRHYPPAYLRYLKARLWNLGRPGFWGTAIFLSVVGLTTWEYWSNPNIFVYKQKNQVASQNPIDSSLSEENRAIAADIDNLPVLFNDFQQSIPSGTASNPKENAEGNSQNSLEAVINKPKSATDTKLNPGLGINGGTSPAVQNPFVVQTENLLRTGMLDRNNQFSGLKTLTTASEPTGAEQTSSSPGSGFANQTNKNQNSVSISPLQAALNQSTNQKFSSFNGTVTQTNALGRVSEPGTTLMPPINSLSSQNSLPSAGLTTGTGYTSTGTNLQQNPYSNLNNGQVLPSNGLNTGTGYTSTGTNLPQNPYTNLNNGQVVPNVAPLTPPGTSAAPNNIAPYSNQIPSQSVVTPTNPVGYGNYGLQQPMQPLQSNYGNYGLQQPTQPPQSNYVLQQPTQSNSLYLRQIRDRYRESGQR